MVRSIHPAPKWPDFVLVTVDVGVAVVVDAGIGPTNCALAPTAERSIVRPSMIVFFMCSFELMLVIFLINLNYMQNYSN